jgi:hypothetical protein
MVPISDVKSAYLNQTGFLIPLDRSRIKGISVKGSASAGQIDLFSTSVAPTAGTYGQSGTTITVTSNGHGLSTGDVIGIAYSAGTGGTATCGNIAVTVTDGNVFTITCINSVNITAGANCRFVKDGGEWLMTFTLSANDIYNNYFEIPDAGILAKNKVHATMTNVTAATVFYA